MKSDNSKRETEMNFTSMEIYAMKATDNGAVASMAADSIVGDVHQLSEIARDNELLESLGHPLSKPLTDLLASPAIQRDFAGLLCSIVHYLLKAAGRPTTEMTPGIIVFIALQLSPDFDFNESCDVLRSAVNTNSDLYPSTDEEFFLMEVAGRFVEDAWSDDVSMEDFAQIVGYILKPVPTLMRLDFGIPDPRQDAGQSGSG